jgi:signal peptidase I
MKDAAVAETQRERALLAAALRARGFVAMPSVLTALALRYLLPSPVRAPQGALHDLSEWVDTHQAPTAVAFFLLFSALVRYWRLRLPAAAAWAEAPKAVAPANARGTVLWTGLVILAAVAALVLRGSLLQSYRVLSGSMLPTLQPGELVLSKQYAYGLRKPWGRPSSARAPQRGDVVVFHHPPIRPDVPEELVKRVIGLPGDTILTRGGYAFINGWRIPTCEVGPYVFIAGDGMLEAHLRMEFLEDRVYITAHGPWQPEEAREPYVVKPGEVFVLGDNRNNSSDSRAWNEGCGGGLRFEEIGGRVDNMLLGTHRDGSWDASRFWHPLGMELTTEGIDDRGIRAGIEHCLTQRPKNTRPPRPERASGPTVDP